MFGLLNINKLPGMTSHDVVARCRRLLPPKTRAGHAGTLDPFATGVLVVCVGPATRLADDVAEATKQYLAEVTFGATSTTDDIEGQITPTGAMPPGAEALRRALASFVGAIRQTPPDYSAVHVDGRRAYALARAGRQVRLAEREVVVQSIELVHLEGPRATLLIDCGKGMYIRALARDLGTALGCGGYCSALTRRRVGRFTLDSAVPLDELTSENLSYHLLPARLAVADWPAVEPPGDQLAELRLGRAIPAGPDLACPRIAALDADGRLVALCDHDAARRRLVPKRVFPMEESS